MSENTFTVRHPVPGGDPEIASELDLTTLTAIDPAFLGRALMRLPLPPDVAESLREIPSETTPGERALMFQWLARLWDGEGDVVEVGPFLGGTTRALGLGMLLNPHASKRRLLTIDRFEGYYNTAELKRTTEPLVRRYGAGRDLLPSLDRGSFHELFHATHAASDYGSFLEIVKASLPDRPEASVPDSLVRAMDSLGPIGLLMVDGCKSWYATKFLMRAFIGKLRLGSHVLFQDYGWYTCFWIPAFCETFRDHFELLSFVDGTFVFRYRAPLAEEKIEREFPDRPESWGKAQFENLFERCLEQSLRMGDTLGPVRYTLQMVAAFAYLGEKREARRLLDACDAHPAMRPHASLIAQCRRSPAYTPDGPVSLEEVAGSTSDQEPASPVSSGTLACGKADSVVDVRITAKGAEVVLRCKGCDQKYASHQPTVAGMAMGRHRCPKCGASVFINPDLFADALERHVPCPSFDEMVELTNEASRITETWYRAESMADLMTYRGVNVGRAAERFLVPIVTRALASADGEGREE
ncbi:hypothetical protein Pan216_24030 [Planctomycetes bacterium Pan216]|uniref:Uncharacterized protein n=1 Tax=Kolteria novifilia TaxID=2527975 RepID=A0A518B3M8_9BACT|nr:hypothetical protein Pan216_24030 [Planctomycetes bacterium Pan216]